MIDPPPRRASSLYLCYLSLEDPLAWSQVVAYLAGLAARGHRIHLLSWEPRAVGKARRREIRSKLADRGIEWHTLRYHKRPSLPATIYDVLRGIVAAGIILRRHHIDVLHARSHVPAACGLAIRRLVGSKLIFDIRGLMAEEFVDAGRWRRGGVAFRITKRVERMAIDRADGIVVLTTRVRHQLFGDTSDPRVHVIPCCADLAAIEARRHQRDLLRDQLDIADRTVLLYLGKFTGWYLEAEMVEFFCIARSRNPRFHFLIVTQSDFALIRAELTKRGVRPDQYTLTRVPPEDVGGHLAAADAGISFIAPAPSKASSSPTKVGEYLAAGLPIVCGSGVGDVDTVVRRYDVGVLLDEFSPDAYRVAVEALGSFVADPAARERCRRAAREELSLDGVGIPAYDRLYRELAQLP